MDAMTFLVEFHKQFSCVPSSERKLPMTNSQIKRMLDQNAVTFNGTKLHSKDIIEFPITELVFFKGNKRQVTLC